MLRRIIKAGTYAGLAASVLAGCSWPQWSTRSGASSSTLADRSSNLPVATQRRPAESRASSANVGSRNSPPSNSSSGGLVIEQGERTSPEGARKATMPDEMAASLLETATVLELRGNLEAARQQYEQALSISPNDVKLLVSFARFADRHGQGSVAADLYQRVLESEGAHPLLWSEAGLSLSRNGRSEAGLAACRKAVAAAPENQRLLANLAEAETAAGQFRQGGSQLTDARANAIRTSTSDRSSAIPVSTSPVSSPTGVNHPFSPGSTARQFERPLPPIASSRRQAVSVASRPGDDIRDVPAFVPATESESNAAEGAATPTNTKDFSPENG